MPSSQFKIKDIPGQKAVVVGTPKDLEEVLFVRAWDGEEVEINQSMISVLTRLGKATNQIQHLGYFPGPEYKGRGRVPETIEFPLSLNLKFEVRKKPKETLES